MIRKHEVYVSFTKYDDYIKHVEIFGDKSSSAKKKKKLRKKQTTIQNKEVNATRVPSLRLDNVWNQLLIEM